MRIVSKSRPIGFDNDGEAVRENGAAGGSEPEHRVVHISRGLDYLYIDSLLLLARRSLSYQLYPRHGVDYRQSLPFPGIIHPGLLVFYIINVCIDDFYAASVCDLLGWF